MASPQPPSPDNKPLGFDEWIAISVAFSAIAAIFFWSTGQNGNQLDISTSPSPTPSSTIPESLNQSQPKEATVSQPLASPTVSPSSSPAKPQPQAIPFLSPAPNIIPQAAIINSVPLPANPTPQSTPIKTAIVPAKISPVPQSNSSKTAAIKFSDVPDRYWARPFIEKLSERKIISGFNDGNFRPEQPVTRAELAAIIEGIVTDQKLAQKSVNFKDVKADNWAVPAIAKSVQAGFMKGYPGNSFRPDENVPKVQVIAALASGLNLKPPTKSASTLKSYQDSKQIPSWAIERVAAATQANLVVNYPNRDLLKPNQPATRADVAAMVYQTLVKLGKAEPQSSDYIVRP